MASQYPGHRILTFFGPIATPATASFRNALCTMVNEGAREITVLFASYGGSTDDSIALHSYLRALPVDLTMHATGIVGSIAIPLFLAAPNRLASASASFFFHEFHWTDRDGQRLSQTTIAERDLLLRAAIDWSKNVMKSSTKLTDEDFEHLKLFQQPVMMSAGRAVEYGLVTAIEEAYIPFGSEPRVVM